MATNSNLINVLDGAMWRILPSTLNRVKDDVTRIGAQTLNSLSYTTEEIDESDNLSLITGRTMIYPISGIMIPRATWFDELWGYSGSLDRRDELSKLVSDNFDNFDRLVLKIDSPGGSTVGGPELAKLIENISASGKEVIAFSETSMTSLGYMFAAAADKIITTKSALVGSIGTRLTIYKRGSNDIYTFSKGELKTASDPNSQIDTKTMVFYSDWVEKDYNNFVNYVAKQRGKPVEEVIATESKYITAEYEPWFVDDFTESVDDLII